MHQIYVMSDGTGRTAQQMVNAALTQFEEHEIRVHLRADIRSEEQALTILQEVVQQSGILFHTIVSDELRRLIIRESKIQNIETVDIMGPMLTTLSAYLANSPAEKPGLFHQLNEAYFNRIEAMEFAFRHDDGQRPNNLHKAEIVLVGVSRTFKTPLSIYLAIKGWFVANVPLILDINPPSELLEVNPKKVIALYTKPITLAELRKARQMHLGNATGDYARLDHVRKELNYANRLYAQHPHWTRLSVTNKPIEEIASEIIRHFAKETKKIGDVK